MLTFEYQIIKNMAKTELEKLKEQFTGCYYEDGGIWVNCGIVNGRIYDEGNSLIDDHYDKWPVVFASSCGDPTLESEVKVRGNTYVQLYFNGDYKKAFNEA